MAALARSERQVAAHAALDAALAEIGEGLLTDDELQGLTAGLPKLGELAVDMGVSDKPVGDWSKEEVLRFLSIAVRAAVPLRVASFTLATNDGAPF